MVDIDYDVYLSGDKSHKHLEVRKMNHSAIRALIKKEILNHRPEKVIVNEFTLKYVIDDYSIVWKDLIFNAENRYIEIPNTNVIVDTNSEYYVTEWILLYNSNYTIYLMLNREK